MYAHQEEHNVELICYQQEHIVKMLEIIKDTFEKYFEDFLAYEGKAGITENDVQKIAHSLGIENTVKKE